MLSYTLSALPPPSSPLIVFISGASESSSSYPAVSRLLSLPHLLYDRAGLGKSPESSKDETTISPAVKAAQDLHTLLCSLDQTSSSNSPPFFPPQVLLVAHSYGAFIAREYLDLHPDSVAGMVLLDPATELYTPDPESVNILMNTLLGGEGGLRFATVTGLREKCKLSSEEWRARAIDLNRAKTEVSPFQWGSLLESIRAKRQLESTPLGDKPLSLVVCDAAGDYRKVYEAGLQAGNGTHSQREKVRDMLDEWGRVDWKFKEKQLALSNRSRLVRLPDCGHNINLLRPEVVVQEILWVYREIMARIHHI
ncbi:hypothetical protein ASPZODRAFT_133675 [Penicilliopsis zonata CBS 506.65]|uniref:AB hydrolase-1 domain-containing protein n=1 Tax=Penicilliopsis zonata CBS 506.65 TaxID=1073090 RepID=A0A1L9SFD4_9EURO|nr:hypothetical protein ASPZODRAFT_133675 [Penicilliopsis zonata CBS 506.65]OJJ45813.1 hypothetical protein ASPZODRAFT_133675 [Penicilliopsis zonata CBS 506.65]